MAGKGKAEKEINTGAVSITKGGEHILGLWERANALQPLTAGGGAWAPVATILLRPEIQPRMKLDIDVIERYGRQFDELPPITVQSGSFVLLDGYQRYEAALRTGREFVRIEEVDVADADLEDYAFEANLRHGVPLSGAERERAAKRYLGRHDDVDDQALAEWAGLTLSAIQSWRAPPAQPAPPAPAAEKKPGKKKARRPLVAPPPGAAPDGEWARAGNWLQAVPLMSGKEFAEVFDDDGSLLERAWHDGKRAAAWIEEFMDAAEAILGAMEPQPPEPEMSEDEA